MVGRESDLSNMSYENVGLQKRIKIKYYIKLYSTYNA